ncbi:MAG: hypothetical protein OJF55_002844 [Rhodanobacteraceae bacterium]|jgi:hypothetical protein|nr:MAG: hypothetical protein OJF55_002844 [Rhodanobacteraceae bacterium]
MALGKLSVVLDANIANFQSDLGRAARIAEQQSRAMQRSFQNAAKNIGAALASGFAVRAIEQFVKTSVDGMLQLGIAAKQVGMPIEQFTALSAVAKRADVDVQSFTAAMLAADRALAQAQSGKGAQAAAFRALGIDPKTIKDSNDLILKAADALSKYRDGTGKAAVEMAIFGRSGTQLNALVDQGSKAIQEQAQHMRDLGVAFGVDAKAQLDAYDNAQKEFSDTLQGLRNRIVIALLPSLQSATEFASGLVKSLDKDTVAGFTEVVNTLARSALVLGGAFVTAGRAIGATMAAASAFMRNNGNIVESGRIYTPDEFSQLKMAQLQGKDTSAIGKPFDTATLSSNVRDAKAIFSSFFDDTAKQWSTLSGKIASFGESVKKALPSTTATNRRTLNFNPGDDGSAAKVKTPEDFTKALRDQVLQLTLSAKQFELYQLAARGASDADLQYAGSLIDVRDKLKAQADAQKVLTDFVAQHQAEIQGVTDAELQFRETMDTATKALNAHLVTWEQFSRIAARAVTDLNGQVKDKMDQMSEFAKQAARNMQDAFADFLFDPFKHGLKGMLGDFADALRRMAAQALAARVFDSIGAWGKQNSGAGGWEGVLASFASAFGGGKASGGPVSAGSLYRVNENGPELLSVAGKDYLMMGNQGGSITPRGKFGAGVQIINNVQVQPTASNRTASQVAEKVARKQQLALARA